MTVIDDICMDNLLSIRYLYPFQIVLCDKHLYKDTTSKQMYKQHIPEFVKERDYFIDDVIVEIYIRIIPNEKCK